MKIIARIRTEDDKLFECLKKSNIISRQVQNAVIVELPYITPGEFLIPDLLYTVKAEYFIEVQEIGGRTKAQLEMDRLGEGTVVCDLAGKPMRAYYVSKNETCLPNSIHARFSVPKCVTINVKSNLDRDVLVTIEKHTITKTEDKVLLNTSQIWFGKLGDAVDISDRYHDAIDAAYRLAEEVDCRRPFYYTEGKK